jgi:hypothetical protein
MDPNELPLDPHHEGVPQGVPKMIFKPMVHSAQTVHLSCTEINTVSKWTNMSVHLTHITKEYHQVGPKQFLSLLHVRRKPCNYLAPRLTLSPNGLKRAFIWPIYIGVPSWASNRSLVRSAQTAHLSSAKINTFSKWTQTSFLLTHVTEEFDRVYVQNNLWPYCMYSANRAPIFHWY